MINNIITQIKCKNIVIFFKLIKVKVIIIKTKINWKIKLLKVNKYQNNLSFD